jgi:putative aminopeptidase FrvX
MRIRNHLVWRIEEHFMKLRGGMNSFACLALIMAGAAGLSRPVAAQDMRKDLANFVETQAVTGYEQILGKKIQVDLAKWKPKIDTLGNVIVMVGSGAPLRVIAAPMDEPGYIVSNITPDGYLRVQRLPQTAANPVFDSLYAAEPIKIYARSGKIVSGVVAGLSVHLQTGRVNPPLTNNLDDIYVDIGADSAAEVRRAGVDVLDPLAIDRHLYDMADGRMTAPAIGDRFGCAALVEMLRYLDPTKVRGTLEVVFLAQQWAGARGVDRILADHASTQKIDEFVYVGRFRRGGAGGGRGAAPATTDGAAPESAPAQGAQAGRGGRGGGRGGFEIAEPKKLDGSGALIGGAGANATLSAFAQELQALAAQNKITAVADSTAPLARAAAFAANFPMPARFAQLGIATRWPSTPGEFIDGDDLVMLTQLLEVYAQGSAETQALAHVTAPLPRPEPSAQAKTAQPPAEIVAKLVEAYGVNPHEENVRAAVQRLLPAWAKTETDGVGNLWVHLGTGKKDPKAKTIAIVAHMDEIGFEVRSVETDGRLVLASRGGGSMEFFAGHVLLVHTAMGDFPGVIELADGWDAPGFSFRPPPGGAGRGGAAGGGGANAPAAGQPAADQAGRGAAGPGGAGGNRILMDVGARSAAEILRMGIKGGDYVTIPKKYRPLLNGHANARSFDDRVGCAAAISAIWALGPQLPGRDVTFVFSTGEEIGLVGATAAAKKMAADGHVPDFVFAIDTFVSSDSPIESKRFADAELGRGFVVRAVDNSDITPREFADRVVQLAKTNNIPVQFGITGGGNDGSVFIPYGTVDVGLGWPLRNSHSPGEVINTRDLDSLAHIVAVLAKSW